MARRTLGSVPVTLLTVLAALVATAAVLWPVLDYLNPEGASSSPDPVTITDYRADFRVDSSGTLRATETITAAFPCCRHGIFRYWEVAAPWDPRTRLIPKDIAVTLDGQRESFDLLWERGRKYRVAKIGHAERTLAPGNHVYQISYTVAGALAPSSAGLAEGESGSWGPDGEGSVFYWDVVAGGWQMEIQRTQVRVRLPGTAEKLQCTYGFDSRGSCTVTDRGAEGILVSTGPLGARTPVTVRATQDLQTPDQVTLPWAPMFDGVLGHSLPLAVLTLVLALAALVGGRLWERNTRERPPGYPVSYEPPAGLGPVQTYYVMHERVPSDALSATLLYQAERGLTRLTQVGEHWTIQGLGGDWKTVDSVTRGVGERLGVTTEGATFVADGSVSAGKELTAAASAIATMTEEWATSSGLLAGRGWETAGQAMVLLAVILGGIIVFSRPGGVTLSAVPFAAFAVGGIGMMRTGVGTRRTATGRDLWSRAGGFHRLLSTSSAQDRFDFSARKELYTAYIPYAVAYGCADKWAEKYQLSTGEEPPQPTWYAGPGPGHGGWGSPSSFASFESSLRSSIGAYEASRSSSSSSGGGFSGGGGGGGGGGGSW